ncbi:hypothetical protein F5887DRAFT_919178 [Amanita rubescens]|nr:hypothetical protein F5887DRAFT_920281 [Amanita rubescens]KAF8341062.1 hypothetical protein F5887DRAFT_919178 [Amanita rubescens]
MKSADGTGTVWVTVVKERRESLPLEGRRMTKTKKRTDHGGGDESDHTNILAGRRDRLHVLLKEKLVFTSNLGERIEMVESTKKMCWCLQENGVRSEAWCNDAHNPYAAQIARVGTLDSKVELIIAGWGDTPFW